MFKDVKMSEEEAMVIVAEMMAKILNHGVQYSWHLHRHRNTTVPVMSATIMRDGVVTAGFGFALDRGALDRGPRMLRGVLWDDIGESIVLGNIATPRYPERPLEEFRGIFQRVSNEMGLDWTVTFEDGEDDDQGPHVDVRIETPAGPYWLKRICDHGDQFIRNPLFCEAAAYRLLFAGLRATEDGYDARVMMGYADDCDDPDTDIGQMVVEMRRDGLSGDAIWHAIGEASKAAKETADVIH